MASKIDNLPKFTGKKKRYFESLMRARESVLEQFSFHKDEALNHEKNSAGERAGMSTHMADLGSDNSRHDLELGLLTDEGEALELIDEALERLAAGEYGKCQDCGCDIPDERLEIKPYATLCIGCKSIREKNGGINPNISD